jgi:hypothetical protein
MQCGAIIYLIHILKFATNINKKKAVVGGTIRHWKKNGYILAK